MSRQQNQMAVRFRPLLAENEGEIKWEHTLDTIFAPGCYSIEIDHTKENVGLPLIYCGEEHYIVGNLVVTDSGTKGPKQHNRLTGQTLTVTDRKSGATKIYTRTFCDGAWSEWRSLVESGAFKNISSTEELVATVEALSGSVETLMGEGEGSVQEAVNEAFIAADKKITENSDSIKDIVTGDTQIALAREIYSLQGKSDTNSFLKRTTAGNTTIHSGVARIKQVGGSIVKNLVDGTFKKMWVAVNGNITKTGNIVKFSSSSTTGTASYRIEALCNNTIIDNHKYYYACTLKCSENPYGKVFIGQATLSNYSYTKRFVTAEDHTNWQRISCSFIGVADTSTHYAVMGDARTENWGDIYLKDFLCIDLTEMFGAGNEPSKEECDAMFATMEALPKGLTVATPTTFKSVGYNHCDTSEAMFGRSIVDGYISDGGNILVFMPCVPCKLGEGENNGYVIATGEGDSWSEENIKAVYFTPFNPQTTGELYLDKLEPQLCRQCNDTHNVYLPECAGYLIIETTTTEKLCAHLAWSGDRAVTDYEPYTESLVSLPEIQQMSAWGLAGVSSGGNAARDIIDFENNKYIRKIGCADLGSLSWSETTVSLPNDENTKYKCFMSYSLNTLYKRPAAGKTGNGIINGYTIAAACMFTEKELGNKQYMLYNTGYLYIRNEDYSSVEDFKNAIQGTMLYYELATSDEYAISPKYSNTYLADDYGTEEFTGSLVPPCDNRFFYMRSLVGEMRNFIDRLYALFTTTDAKYVANRIYNAVTSATSTTEAVEE